MSASSAKNFLHVNVDPVFKTPMTFSPRLAAEQAKPSPSRIELWKEELGLDDEDGANLSGENISNSDDEPEVDQNTNKVNYSLIEFKALQRELEERNNQRDELLFKIKTIRDKTNNYCTRLQKEESNKKQQLKIIRKTHELQIKEKEELIQSLETIVDEQEAKLQSVEAKENGKQEVLGIKKLVEQITKLHAEKAELSTQIMAVESKLQEFGNQHEEDIKTMKRLVKKRDKENKKLHEEVEALKSLTKVDSGTIDTQKLIHRLESENDRLQKQLADQELSHGKTHDGHKKDSTQQTEKLLEENEKLHLQVKTLEKELAQQSSTVDEKEQKYKDEIKKLTEENRKISREVRELWGQITALQAKSPEVITKFTTVEDQDTKQDLQNAQNEVMRLESETSNLKSENTDLVSQMKKIQTQFTEAQQQSRSLQEALKESEESLETFKSSTAKETKAYRSQIAELQEVCESADRNLEESKRKASSLKAQVKKYENEVESLENELNLKINKLRFEKEQDIERVKQEMKGELSHMTTVVNRYEEKLSVIQPQFLTLSKNYEALKQECQNMPRAMKKQIDLTTKQVCKALSEVNKNNQELVRKYRKEMSLRKKYHNELVELRGNIRVFCRVRPCIKEDGVGAKTMVSFDEDDDNLVNVLYKGRSQTFDMDRVFNENISQTEVFDEVSALVTSCIDGYNVCIFAYGQTGSGKTYTMEGSNEDPGINQRALRRLFEDTDERSGEWKYSIEVSVLEIYNEMPRDLLSSDPTMKLEVKMHEDGGVHVPGLTSILVESVEDVNAVFAMGQENRATACTNMNEHSSRSHALLCIKVTGLNLTTGAKTIGKLNLVDLAGSERVSKSGADGTRLKEAQNINKSLSCIGDVIHALRTKQPHVPYRNSKLTYLLQDSLGGDSKTLMIVQVSPVEKNVAETVASLNFAQRVRSVELGQASKRMDNGDTGFDGGIPYGLNEEISNGHTSKGTSKVLTPNSRNARRK